MKHLVVIAFLLLPLATAFASPASEAQGQAKSTLSGAAWCLRYPESRRLADLEPGFRTRVTAFIAALEAGGARVEITETLRYRERGYLMHWAWQIARENFPLEKVPPLKGVNIDWTHRRTGVVDEAASRRAAADMVTGFSMAHDAAWKTSMHYTGQAIDMVVYDFKGKTFTGPRGEEVTIADYAALYDFGARFGVIKLREDPPHWSSNGF